MQPLLLFVAERFTIIWFQLQRWDPDCLGRLAGDDASCGCLQAGGTGDQDHAL